MTGEVVRCQVWLRSFCPQDCLYCLPEGQDSLTPATFTSRMKNIIPKSILCCCAEPLQFLQIISKYIYARDTARQILRPSSLQVDRSFCICTTKDNPRPP
jgi:hypothetical protein